LTECDKIITNSSLFLLNKTTYDLPGFSTESDKKNSYQF